MLKKRILSLGILTAFLTGMAVFPTSIASAAPLGNGQTYYVATDGRVIEEGLTDQILEDPQHAYTQQLVYSLL